VHEWRREADLLSTSWSSWAWADSRRTSPVSVDRFAAGLSPLAGAKLGGEVFGFAGSSTANALPFAAAALVAAVTFAIAAAAARTTVTVDVSLAAAGRGGVSSLEVLRGTLAGDSNLDAVAGG